MSCFHLFSFINNFVIYSVIRCYSKKSSPGAGGSNTTIDGHMVYEGAVEVSSAPATYRRRGGNVAVELSLLLLVVNTFRVGPFTG